MMNSTSHSHSVVNVQVCMIHYMVTLPIYPAHTQKLRWSKTEPLIFCSKSTPLHVYLILINGTTTCLPKQTQRSRRDREKARSLPNYSSAGGSIFERKSSPLLVLLPLTLVHVTIISHPDYYKSLLISLHLSSWLPFPTILSLHQTIRRGNVLLKRASWVAQW